MTTVLERPRQQEQPAPGRTPPPVAPRSSRQRLRDDEYLLVLAAALLITASLPLVQVFVGLGVLRPVISAVLAVLGLGWAVRRIGLGPVAGFVTGAIGYLVFTGAVFLSDTLWAGVVPTTATLSGIEQLLDAGLQLSRVRPTPAYPEPSLVFLAVSGAWLVAMAVDEFLFHAAAPGRAIMSALVLWAFPLALVLPSARPWAWAVPVLIPAALLLLAFANRDTQAWGRPLADPGGQVEPLTRARGRAGQALAAVALLLGAVTAVLVPGYGNQPWYQLRGSGGTTLTTNPIVSLRPSLVATDTGPIFTVNSERPVYLRTTALDVYGSNEEWTNSGITGRPLSGGDVPLTTMLGDTDPVRVQINVGNLDGAVLVPAPYQAQTVSGPAADAFQYDPSTATFTLDRGAVLASGDRYTVDAGVPAPSAERLNEVDAFSPRSDLVALPDGVPGEVAETARRIVGAARAETAFQQAIAIQNELRGWEYSLTPPQGHSGTAMASFLDQRVGYCEQFAGTMAVMLRTLDIPARVAVGFTPGTLVDPDVGLWQVSNANAHAWVEVLFPGFGWVSFEPTPRSDGNVLVPTAANLAPSQTQSDPEIFEPVPEAFPEDQQFLPQPGDVRRAENAADAARGLAQDGGTGAGGGRWVWVSVAAAVAALVFLVLLRPGRLDIVTDPRDRVLRAQERIDRLGRGLGVRAFAWETDREYLDRLIAGVPGGLAAATALARCSARARYAEYVPADTAVEAERATRYLSSRLLGPLSHPRRLFVHARGALPATLARARTLTSGRRGGGRGGSGRTRRGAARTSGGSGPVPDA